MSWRAMVGSAFIVLAACGGADDPAGPPDPLAGTFALVSRNGQSLPVSVSIPLTSGATVTSVIGGSVFFVGQQHETAVVVRGHDGGSSTESVFTLTLGHAVYVLNGRTITLSMGGGAVATGTFGGAEGRTLTVNMGSPWGTLVFQQPR
jgi:hypothetical protein